MNDERAAASLSAAGTLSDLLPELQDYARAWILGLPLPQLKADEAALARRIADEELERRGISRHSPAAEWEPDDE